MEIFKFIWDFDWMIDCIQWYEISYRFILFQIVLSLNEVLICG